MWRKLMQRQKFHSILFDELPDLKGITVCGLETYQDAIELSFDLPTPIDHLPRKWEQRGFTTVRENMEFADIKSFSMSLDCPFPIVDAELQDLGKDGIRFIAQGPYAHLEVIAYMVGLYNPTGVRFAGDHFTVS